MFGELEKSLPLFRAAAIAAERPGCVPKGRAGLPAGPGLSKAHISPLSQNEEPERPPYRVERWKGAGLVRVVSPYIPPDDLPFGDDEEPTRGEITEFSPDSQRRLKQFLAKIPDATLCESFMATLTYPGNSCPQAIPKKEEATKYKRHLDSFGKSLRRKYPAASIVWVLEFQSRGVAHYHALIFGVPVADLLEVRAWIAKRWNKIVGGDSDHLKAGTQCDLAKSPGGARNYLAKYLSKGNQAANGAKVGRYWGKINKAGIPHAEEAVEELTQPQCIVALRIARKLAAKRQWEAARSALHKKAGKANDAFASMTGPQFWQMCEAFNRGDTWHSWNNGTGQAGASVLALNFAVTGTLDKKIRWPRRPRSRNNSTVNLYCNANAFWSALTNHPIWQDEQETKEKTGRSLRKEGKQSTEPGSLGQPDTRNGSRLLVDDPLGNAFGSFGDEEAPFIRVPESWLRRGTPMEGTDSGLRDSIGSGRPDVVLGHDRGSRTRKAPRLYTLDPEKRFQRDPF